jgi:hypothetical protein
MLIASCRVRITLSGDDKRAVMGMAGGSPHYLQAVYDAALSDEHWPRALALLSEQVSSVGAFLIAVDQVGFPFAIQQVSSVYRPEHVRYYFDNLRHYDEPVLTRTFADTPPMRLLRDCDVWNVRALEDRPDYRWMRETLGARRKAGVRLSQGKGWMDLITLQFEDEWEPSPDALQGRLDVLLPHVAKVVEINRKFSILRHQYNAVLAALDHVRIGTCVTGANGHVVVANAEAHRIFSLGDGLSLSRAGFLNCSSGDLTAELAAKIRSVSHTARGEGSEHEIVVFATRPSGSRPYLIEVAPLRDSVGELESGLTGALVFIVDPDNDAAPKPSACADGSRSGNLPTHGRWVFRRGDCRASRRVGGDGEIAIQGGLRQNGCFAAGRSCAACHRRRPADRPTLYRRLAAGEVDVVLAEFSPSPINRPG